MRENKEIDDIQESIFYKNLEISGAVTYKAQIAALMQRLGTYKEIAEYLPYIALFPLRDYLSHYGEA